MSDKKILEFEKKEEENEEEVYIRITEKGKAFVESVLKKGGVYALIEFDESKFEEAWADYTEHLVKESRYSFREFFKDEIATPVYMRELGYDTLSDREKEEGWRKVRKIIQKAEEEVPEKE